MIRYALECAQAHAFEAWFGASADYDDQLARGLLACPVCDSPEVRKQIMAPAVAVARRKALSPEASAEASVRAQWMREAAGKVRAHVEANFDYVGDRFAREARDIHDGLAPDRGVYGEATRREVEALAEDGVKVAPLPPANAASTVKPRVN